MNGTRRLRYLVQPLQPLPGSNPRRLPTLEFRGSKTRILPAPVNDLHRGKFSGGGIVANEDELAALRQRGFACGTIHKLGLHSDIEATTGSSSRTPGGPLRSGWFSFLWPTFNSGQLCDSVLF